MRSDRSAPCGNALSAQQLPATSMNELPGNIICKQGSCKPNDGTRLRQKAAAYLAFGRPGTPKRPNFSQRPLAGRPHTPPEEDR
jgi:hypothetical protein